MAAAHGSYDVFVRVVSYNIHAGSDADRNPSLPQLARTLCEADADVYLLQEVDRFFPRSQLRDQAEWLAVAVKARAWRFYGRLRSGRANYGNAILSRVPILENYRVPLPSDGGEPRAALGVLVAGGITIWNTHLGLDAQWRGTQLSVLAAHVGTAGAAVVGGDFNASTSSLEVAHFVEVTGLRPVSSDDLTFPALAPTARIDYLFARGMVRRSAGTIAGPGSDHCLIWAELGVASAE
jgi:endonuclease/exonuclease/phosphatase family metal-dependent hydrolase